MDKNKKLNLEQLVEEVHSLGNDLAALKSLLKFLEYGSDINLGVTNADFENLISVIQNYTKSAVEKLDSIECMLDEA